MRGSGVRIVAGRGEIVVGGFPLHSVRGYPLSEAQPQCSGLRPRRAHARAPGPSPTTHRAGLSARAVRTREPDTSPGAAWERHNTRERPDQTQPHNGPASPAPVRTREPGDDDESPRPGAACEEQSTLPF